MAKLTEAAVRNLKPGPTRREVPDGVIGGLYLIVQPTGAKSWSIRYRRPQDEGRIAKLTLGRYPAITLAKARELARDAIIEIGQGKDPAAEKAARSESAADTVAAVVDTFIERYAKPRTRRWRDTDRMLRRHVVPAWGKRRLGDIHRHEIHSLLDGIVDDGAPFVANRLLAAIRKMFNWSIERGYLEASPVQGIKAPSKEVTRDRVLTDAELVAVWRGAKRLGWPFGRIAQLLILTGQRRDEVAGAKWSEIDTGKALWIIARERRKGSVAHEVPLSGMALDILGTLPRFEADYLFPAQNGGTGFASGFSKAKARLDRFSGVADWRLHDLRRTLATRLQGLGTKLEVIEEVLGHVSGSRAGIVGVYQRHRFEAEKRAALDAWAYHMMTLLDPAISPGKVAISMDKNRG